VVLCPVTGNESGSVNVAWNVTIRAGWTLRAFALDQNYAPVYAAGERIAK